MRPIAEALCASCARQIGPDGAFVNPAPQMGMQAAAWCPQCAPRVLQALTDWELWQLNKKRRAG